MRTDDMNKLMGTYHHNAHQPPFQLQVPLSENRLHQKNPSLPLFPLRSPVAVDLVQSRRVGILVCTTSVRLLSFSKKGKVKGWITNV